MFFIFNKKPRVGVGIMIFNDKNQILLGKRAGKDKGKLHGAGQWTMPGGKLNWVETPETGAEREVLEETGLKIKNLKFETIANSKVKGRHLITIGFSCKYFSGEVEIKEPEEILEWDWFDIDKLPSPLFFRSKAILKNYKDKKYYSN